MLGRCPLCGMPVIWLKSKSGHSIPINTKSSKNGNIFLVKDLTGTITDYEIVAPGYRKELYLSHFDTCKKYKK